MAQGAKEAAPPNGRDQAEPMILQVRFTDGSVLKLRLLDEGIALATPYGKLLILVRDILQIDFAQRIPDRVAKQIEQATVDLGSQDFQRREAASAQLLKHQDRAYAALLRAAKHNDLEVARRAEQLLEKLRETVPEEDLEIRKRDVIYTADSKIAGRIEAATLKATTTQFGAVLLKLEDLRKAHSSAFKDEGGESDVVADPGHLGAFQNQIGKTLRFKVTGAVGGTVYGTEVYTIDSSLPTAAVHAGVLRAGQTGIVQVKIVPQPFGFLGSVHNGVTSNSYGSYPGYQILKRGNTGKPAQHARNP